MINLILSLIYYAMPVAAIVFFVVSLVMFCRAKAANKRDPGSYSDNQMLARTVMLAISSVMVGILLLFVVGLMVLLFGAVAFM